MVAPEVRLITVPHSGTRFTGKVLDALGFPMGRRSEHHTDDLGFPMPYVAEGKVVVAVRDPMMAEISRVNRGSGLPVKHWSHVAAWRGRPNVCWFRVGRGQVEVDRLAAFLRVPAVVVDPAPVNTSSDTHGLKAPYARGEVPELVRPAFEWLQEAEDVKDLFRWLGYELPWMTPPASMAA